MGMSAFLDEDNFRVQPHEHRGWRARAEAYLAGAKRALALPLLSLGPHP